MDSRRNFLKKAALLAGGASLTQSLPPAIAKALAINPALGSTFYDAEHVVILMQENRSFDHAFGTLQGVRGFNDPRTIRQPNKNKVWLQTRASGETFAPFHLDIKDSKITWMGCLPHNWTDQTDARNNGKMDKWLDVKRPWSEDFADLPLTMGHYTREDIPFYYSLADSFTICDQNFCSSITGTNPNRLYFWTGNIRENLTGKALVWNGDSEFSGKANWKTFPERLSEIGVDWKIYQNEISSSSAGYTGKANSWLANFGCNPMEYFPQYKVKYSARYRELLGQRKSQIEQEIKDTTDSDKLHELHDKHQQVLKELNEYTEANFEKLDERTKEIHNRAFVNNRAHPDYMKLETMNYEEGGEKRELEIPKGDILYQFREDVKNGSLPTVSWLTPPQLFSDHPDSPWFGAWYVSEIMDILTENPDVWKKTIFILTYDENDGYFDHVAPFVGPNPYQADTGKVSSDIDAKLEFVRRDEQYYPDSGRESNIGLGYRVPMIIASPWTRGGWVNSQVFDHTSSLQFLEKFISHKANREIKETNISNWRRAVCGDLTSTFRPYKGEAIEKPMVLKRKPFIQGIHQAQFKDLPTGYKALTKEEIKQIEENPLASPYFPKQEKGVRNSCTLPYELYAHGTCKTDGQYEITFEVAKDVFGDAASGSPFTVYNSTPYKGEIGSSRNYALSPGKSLSDNWSIAAFENKTYHLEVYGPNGFYRSFKGQEANPKIKTRCTYEKKKGKNAFTGRISIQCINEDSRAHRLLIEDISYSKEKKSIVLKSGESTVVSFDISKQDYWYDFLVSTPDFNRFEEQYAGRIEFGKQGKTDPLLGR
ncbi:phospholipase C, phosphocholine-specific [Sphingobacterium sp. UT-1RO-CII-1]|uniref:phosphocholine-specific phospholipase C n=1 Tax=Sphingobacterium sp. UT-1RO-CII-1 TaxID=2995225 RepID=UPI00227A8E63|nr:phospholipase C, phosphocholine-specific [Sphingobacterium sp. UT-1RO-CII-1]MCY4781271.1 phospholipase C, phosphocholine-specific [Sphingobacterium sp. UT-1RO-CII-1]